MKQWRGLSEATHGIYSATAQPLIRAMATEEGAEQLRRMHPLRQSHELLSDQNPAMQSVAVSAEKVRENRRPVASDNMFLQWERMFSDWVVASLNAYRDWRDLLTEYMFFSTYRQPLLQAMLGVGPGNPNRRKPGQDADHEAFVERRIEELRTRMEKGGPREAAIRALLYIRMPENAADERAFEMLRRIRAEQGKGKSLEEFKQDLREQYLMLHLDENRAVGLIPALLKGKREETNKFLSYLRKVIEAGGPLNAEGQKRLARIKELFKG